MHVRAIAEARHQDNPSGLKIRSYYLLHEPLLRLAGRISECFGPCEARHQDNSSGWKIRSYYYTRYLVQKDSKIIPNRYAKTTQRMQKSSNS